MELQTVLHLKSELAEMLKDGKLPCGCDESMAIGIQYRNHPEEYDGVSEWMCRKCQRRWGRWSGKELKNKEYEYKYGVPRSNKPNGN